MKRPGQKCWGKKRGPKPGSKPKVPPPLNAAQIILAVLHPHGIARAMATARTWESVAGAIVAEVDRVDAAYPLDSYLAIEIITAIGSASALRKVEEMAVQNGGVLRRPEMVER